MGTLANSEDPDEMPHNAAFHLGLNCLLRQNRKKNNIVLGAQWLSGRVLDSRPRGRGFEPHRHHCVVSLSKNINPSLVLVQPRKTRPFITERLLMGRTESNQTNKITLFWKLQPVTHQYISWRDHPDYTVSNFMGNSDGPKRVKNVRPSH